MQQGDVLLFQTEDDGDIRVSDEGLVEMTGGLETAVYLSLFGGNEDGSEWWGNVGETEPSKKYVSETQNLLLILPVTSANILRVEDAVKRDLQWILDGGFAKTLKISSEVKGLNRVALSISIDGISFQFNLPWGME